jgi:hypothetical protein
MKYKTSLSESYAVLFFAFFLLVCTQRTKGQNNRRSKINRIVLSHALEQSPQGLWYPFISAMAKKKNLVSIIPQLPNPQRPTLKSWQEAITPLANKSPASTVLIGHSLGCVSLLHFLDARKGDEKFPLLILVAPTAFEVGYEALKEFFESPFQLSSLKNKVRKIVVIITPTDPVLKPDPLQHGLLLVKEADAKLVVIKEGNHFWKGDTFRELEEVIEQEIDAVMK